MKTIFDKEYECCKIRLQIGEEEELWDLKKLLRFAKIYNKRILIKQTKSRKERVEFFNYILKNWDNLHENGKVRVVPSESSNWLVNKDDAIFKLDYGRSMIA